MNTTISIELLNHVSGTVPELGKIYHPGQELKGIVVLKCLKQQRIRTVHIAFIGECTTEYKERSGESTSTHRETIVLCNLKQCLFQGPFDVASQVLQWPFEFTIPTTCSYTRVKGNEQGYIPNGDSLLPPSFSWSQARFGHEPDASIRYRIEVDVQSGGLLHNHKSQMPIVVRQFSTLPPPEINLAVQQFYPVPNWRSEKLRTTQHTFREKMKHAFTNDPELSTPNLAFRACVHFPRRLAIHQSIIMGISVKHYTSGPNDPVDPTLLLEDLSLTLKTFVQMTVARGGFSSNDCAQEKQEIGNLRLKFKPQKLPLDGEVTFVPNEIKLADMVKGSLAGLIADFVTYTVNHQHVMKVHTTIRHAETGHQFSTKAEVPIQMLNAQEPVDSVSRAVDKQVAREVWELDDALPRYEDIVRPSAISPMSVPTAPISLNT